MGVELDLQAALVARLKAAAVGTGLTATGVFDVRPQQAQPGGWPYLIVAEAILTELPVDEGDMMTASIRIHSWSRVRGQREILTMQGEVYAALHMHRLSLPRFGGAGQADWRSVLLRRQTSRVLPAEDGLFHGLCEYRAILEAI